MIIFTVHTVLWTNPLSVKSVQLSYLPPLPRYNYRKLTNSEEDELRQQTPGFDSGRFWRFLRPPVVYLKHVYDFLNTSGLQLFVTPLATISLLTSVFIEPIRYVRLILIPTGSRLLLAAKNNFVWYWSQFRTVQNKVTLVNLRNPYHNVRLLLQTSLTYKLTALLFISNYVYGLSQLNVPLTHALFTNLTLVMPIYLIWQTFIYFTKTLTISKYTTQVAAFWQRTLFVFWSLEIIVFLIFVYIWFISPETPKMFLGQAYETSTVYISVKQLIIIFIEVLTGLVVTLYLLISNNYRNILTQKILVCALLILLLRILLSEYHFFIYNTSKWTNIHSMVTKEGVEETTYTLVKTTDQLATDLTLQLNDLFTLHHQPTVREELFAQSTYSLIWFLRFWHVLLVFLIFSFTIFNYFYTNEISYEMLSVWVFHQLILICFNFTYFIFYIKSVGKEYLRISPKYYYLDDVSLTLHNILIEVINLFS